MDVHHLYINHNGVNDKSRKETIKLLSLIKNNLAILANMKVKVQVHIFTDSKIKSSYKELKSKKISHFPSLIIPKNKPFTKYDDIYNIYLNAINRAGGNTSVSPYETEDMDESVGNEIGEEMARDYIFEELKNFDDGESEVGEGLTPEDIKKMNTNQRSSSDTQVNNSNGTNSTNSQSSPSVNSSNSNRQKTFEEIAEEKMFENAMDL
jgi:hypothetical protein